MIRRVVATAARGGRTPLVARSAGTNGCTNLQFNSLCQRFLCDAVAQKEERILQTVVQHVPDSAVPHNEKFAVIAFSGKQYKCVEDDLLICNRQQVDIGEEILVKDVLLVGSPNETIIGRPLVQQASVRMICEQHPQDKKTIVFKMKRRKGYKRKNGFRSQLSVFRVLEINDGQEV